MKRAAIVGGGIGGLTTAIALRKIGFDVQIYERSAELKEVGSGMSLWPNAVRSLEQIDSGVLKKLRTNGRSLRRLFIREASGSLIKTVRLFGTDSGGIAVHRAELRSCLAEAVPNSSIYFNHTFSRLEKRTASVVLHFDNGTSTEVDLVVGCDGIHSAVRKSLNLECKLTNRPYCVWRGMVQINPANDVRHLGLDRDGDFSESYGHGRRFGILRLGPGRIHWYAIANNSLIPADLSDSASLLQLFSAWHAPIPELIGSAESIIRTRVQDRLSFLPWTKGQIATLGDAAHPISPNFGQGACLAIEDAVVLAACLRSTPEISNALRRYEKSRHHRCLEVLLASGEVGRLAQIQNRTLVHLRKHLVKLARSAFTTYWFRRSCDFHPPSLATC
jgi:2-polyprenyl-6-methoxyphenol hydroxylase-like FAD-dependent oxidoreductase